MALDFPSSPTTGQTFAGPNGVVWTWDGVKWVSLGSGGVTPIDNDIGRNLVHNSMFNIAQRGVGPWTTTGFTVDRWQCWGSAGSTISTVTNIMGDAIRAQIGDETANRTLYTTFTGGAAAGDGVNVQQSIEDARRLAGKTVTVSFWAAASAGTPRVGVSLDQSFGTGGSPSALVSGVGQSVVISTVWTRYSMTFAVASAALKAFGSNNDSKTILNIWYSAGTTWATGSGNVGVQSAAIALWGVQAELSSVVSSIEHLDPLLQIHQCLRFYEVINFSMGGQNASGMSVWYVQSYTVAKRANPTIVIAGGSATALTGAGVSSQGVNAFQPNGTTNSTGQWIYSGTVQASADI